MGVFRKVVPLLMIMSVACTGSKNRFEKFFKELAGPEDKMFRGVMLGDDRDRVKHAEAGKVPAIEDSIVLGYQIHRSDSEDYRINYLFQGQVLTSVNIEAYLGPVRDGELLSQLLVERFNRIYGTGSEERGSMVWNKDSLIIELTDESEEFGYGKISLWFYREIDSPGEDDEVSPFL
jgi:hypothetical protein